jgi:DNA polymerase bacteriophage-type
MPEGLSAMETIPSCLRGAFRAPEGFRIVAADFSQIELRVLAWLTGCAPMIQSFAEDRDLYVEFAMQLFNVPREMVTKLMRQIAKPAVLSCGYGTGGGKLIIDKNDDEIKTGLWGYAESMGVAMTQEEAHDAVELYRSIYPEVPAFWYAVMEPVLGLLKNPGHCIAQFGRLTLQHIPGKLLAIALPSARRLHYLKPALVGRDVEFDSINATTKQMQRRRLYGSLLTENLVQAIARDIMAEGMLRVDAAGFEIVGHTHDEVITLTPVDSALNSRYIKTCLEETVDWCDDLPLKVDAWEGEVYKK